MSTVKDLKDYKDKLYSSLTRELEAFEKNFILISSGILAFSVTFIKEIVKIDEATLLFFLFVGWILMIVAVGVMMFAFLISGKLSRQLSNHVDEFLAARNKFELTDTLDANDMRNYKLSQSALFKKGIQNLERFRYCAVGIFIAGLFSFSFFVGHNLVQEKKHKSKEEFKDKNCCCNHCQLPPKEAKISYNANDTNVIINYHIYRHEKVDHDECHCENDQQDDEGEYLETIKQKHKGIKKWHSKS